MERRDSTNRARSKGDVGSGELSANESASFEEAMKRLDEIVRLMESGQLPLEKMIEVYEEGRRLVDFCTKKLDEAEKKIELLEKRDGEWVARPVTDSELGVGTMP